MRLVMMGTGTFAEPTFLALLGSRHQVVGLVTQPDRPVGEARGSTRQTGTGMKALAEQHGVPVYQPESINTAEGVANLREWAPDLLVVAAYGQILNNDRSEEHTSELQSPMYLVCRLLLEKKKKNQIQS